MKSTLVCFVAVVVVVVVASSLVSAAEATAAGEREGMLQLLQSGAALRQGLGSAAGRALQLQQAQLVGADPGSAQRLPVLAPGGGLGVAPLSQLVMGYYDHLGRPRLRRHLRKAKRDEEEEEKKKEEEDEEEDDDDPAPKQAEKRDKNEEAEEEDSKEVGGDEAKNSKKTGPRGLVCRSRYFCGAGDSRQVERERQAELRRQAAEAKKEAERIKKYGNFWNCPARGCPEQNSILPFRWGR